MNAANSPVGANNPKKRARRENRRFSENDRSATSLTNELIKALTKTPTRAIPSAKGFSGLSKSEMKKDIKDIERNCGIMMTNDTDFECVMDNGIQRSMRPMCNGESSILKKRQRLESWLRDESLAEKEVMFWEHKANRAREAYAQHDAEKEQWQLAFLSARKTLMEAQLRSSESVNRLRSDAKELLALCAAEMASGGKKSKRTLKLRDLAEELSSRQAALEDRCAQIDRLAEEAVASGCKTLPVLSVSVKALNYPEDLHWRQRKAVTAVDCQSQNVIESKESSAKSVKSSTSTTSAEETSDSMDGVAISAADQLGDIFASLEESVRTSELALRDLDMFFASDREAEDCAALDVVMQSNLSALLKKTHGDDGLLSNEKVGAKISDAFMSLSNDSNYEGRWAAFMNELFDAHSAKHGAGTVTRKKKKSAELVVPLRAGVRPRTEHGAAVLLSPLSMYEDRMLGTLSTNTIFLPTPPCHTAEGKVVAQTFTRTLSLPADLVQAEDDAMERCRLQSAAAAAELRIAQLRQANSELKAISANGANSLRRIQQVYRQTQMDDEAERARIRKELVYYGIAEPHESDPPLSPMSFLPLNGAHGKSGVNKGGANNSRSRNGNARSGGVPRSGFKNATASVIAPLPQVNSEPVSTEVSSTAAAHSGKDSKSSAAVSVTAVEVAPAALPDSSTSRRRSSGRNAPLPAAAVPEAVVVAAPVVAVEEVLASPSKPVRPRRRNL